MGFPTPTQTGVLNLVDSLPANLKAELESRGEEVQRLSVEQTQFGTTVPQLYGSLGKFITNPSTVSVETFKRMIDTDETIGSCVDFLILAMIARWGQYKHPNKKIEAFVRRNIERMPRSFHEYLEEIFSSEWAGFSVTEKVWEFCVDFDGAPAFLLKDLITYQPLTIVFACDQNGNVLSNGIYQYQRFYNQYLNGYMGFGDFDDLNGFRPDTLAAAGDLPYPIRVAADLSYLTVRIPLEKVIHCVSSVSGKFRSPYGRSPLRRIYKSWVMKDAFLKMWLVAADRKGTPLVVGYAAPNNTVLEQKYGEGMLNSQRADVAMQNAFDNMHNSSYLVLPGKKDEQYSVDSVQVQGDMNIYKDAIEYCNRAFMRGFLIPPLVMSAGDGAGSYALGETHAKLFNKVIDGKSKPYKQSILAQMIQPLIAYNFPRSEWENEGLGDFVLEEFEPEIMNQLADVYSKLTQDGYMSPSDQIDLDHVREKMGMKKKTAAPEEEVIDPFADDPNSEESNEDDVDQNELGNKSNPVEIILNKAEDVLKGKSSVKKPVERQGNIATDDDLEEEPKEL